MPPKARFTREQITEAALDLVRDTGFENLTAGALGQRLGSSACPVFTVFESMEEVQQSVLQAARGVYKEYVERGLAEEIAFKGVGTQYIQFAIREPRLFRILFMSEHASIPRLDSVLPLIDESYDRILDSIVTGYRMRRETAERLYRHLWIYTHGIATLCATGMCSFTGDEISRMMTEVFVGLLKNMREETVE